MFGSIESRHGVDDPGYTPPADVPEVVVPERVEFDTAVALWSFLVPVVGLLFAVARFGRNEVGPGLACLVLAMAGTGAYELVAPVVAGAHGRVPTIRQATQFLSRHYVGTVTACHQHKTFVECADYYELESSNPTIEPEAFTLHFRVGWHGRYLVTWER